MTDGKEDNPNRKPPPGDAPPEEHPPVDQSPAEAAESVGVGQAGSAPGAPDAQPPAIPDLLPVLPIRVVGFPGTVMPLNVTRASSRRLLDESLAHTKFITLATQRDEEEEEPSTEGLFEVGAAAMVLKLIRQPDETVSIIVHGLARVQLGPYVQRAPFFVAHVKPLRDVPGAGKNFDAGVEQLRQQARQLIEMTPNAPEQALTVLMNIEDPSNLADFLAANLNLDLSQKQDLLEEPNVAKRIRAVHRHVSTQLEILKLQHKIQQDVQTSISDSQRKFFLREQLKAIQTELGEGEQGPGGQTVAALRTRLDEAEPPEKVRAETDRELDRLESIPPASPEYAMILTYVELIADLPWNKASDDNLDLERARRVLDRDHFDLDKVKRRLVEYLAVRKLNPQGRGPILCLIGPPGVGKTSLGQSIANALGRAFVRMSLGGIRDEAEIRGHRRTYIGAMPGRIIQEIRRAGTNNPVMMLDELDKLGADFRGDPSSALLEVLDPRQNNTFADRYLDVPFDLSQVIFIGTANYIGNVPPPLRDRMEVIEIAGYTDNDKLQIARRYLVPRQLGENGLTPKRCKWMASGMRKVIDDYTREAGVRELERQIGAVCRGIAAQVAPSDGKSRKVYTVDAKLVQALLGAEKYIRDVDLRTKLPGVAVGMAYTPAGGEVLFVEAAAYPGKGHVALTGQIGEVMQVSARAALSLFKTQASQFNFNVAALNEQDLHIHVPAGAVPKDGPSAGCAMYTAIASLLLGIPVRQRIAMTGEITLRGLVLPVGGIKEKALAAARARIKTIILPHQNERDMEEVDAQVKKRCTFTFVETVDQLLEHTLGKGRIEHTAAGGAVDGAVVADDRHVREDREHRFIGEFCHQLGRRGRCRLTPRPTHPYPRHP